MYNNHTAHSGPQTNITRNPNENEQQLRQRGRLEIEKEMNKIAWPVQTDEM